MLQVKECTPAKPMHDSANLADIIKCTIPLWQAQKPDSHNINKTNLSGKVNGNVAALPQSIPENQSNQNPLNYVSATPYGLPYTVSPNSYG